MSSRRSFLRAAALMGVGVVADCVWAKRSLTTMEQHTPRSPLDHTSTAPVVVSTWGIGLAANEAAMQRLTQGRSALDAVEAGVRVSESDPNVDSVGKGGLPDREGRVTLDSCIMDHRGMCGSVAFLEHIENPVSVARAVMEKTPHVMLVGEGALQFALNQGFSKTNLLTEEARKRWEKWKKESGEWKGDHDYHNLSGSEDNHDTIGMLALDKMGNLSGACTTSGLGYKLRGRVGDSPIIGGGLFVDNEVGAATATGKGEAVMRICGTHLIVELMRQGKTPLEACKLAVERMWKVDQDPHYNVGFLAVNKAGEVAGFSLRPGFNYALFSGEKNILINADSKFSK
ncbi:MAG: N(4)-(beta-N-acetylglucosaminyl)-L-asparaginase [Bacteroidetes bacterium]|nr:N(4)-(beta-N-acetylglucosaminyl)-L-asparaginase [Bacteroidota bacterium]